MEPAFTTRSFTQKELQEKCQELNLTTLLCGYAAQARSKSNEGLEHIVSICDPVVSTGPKEGDTSIPSDLVGHVNMYSQTSLSINYM